MKNKFKICFAFVSTFISDYIWETFWTCSSYALELHLDNMINLFLIFKRKTLGWNFKFMPSFHLKYDSNAFFENIQDTFKKWFQCRPRGHFECNLLHMKVSPWWAWCALQRALASNLFGLVQALRRSGLSLSQQLTSPQFMYCRGPLVVSHLKGAWLVLSSPSLI